MHSELTHAQQAMLAAHMRAAPQLAGVQLPEWKVRAWFMHAGCHEAGHAACSAFCVPPGNGWECESLTIFPDEGAVAPGRPFCFGGRQTSDLADIPDGWRDAQSWLMRKIVTLLGGAAAVVRSEGRPPAMWYDLLAVNICGAGADVLRAHEYAGVAAAGRDDRDAESTLDVASVWVGEIMRIDSVWHATMACAVRLASEGTVRGAELHRIFGDVIRLGSRMPRWMRRIRKWDHCLPGRRPGTGAE